MISENVLECLIQRTLSFITLLQTNSLKSVYVPTRFMTVVTLITSNKLLLIRNRF